MLGRKSESKLNRKPIPAAVSIPGIVPPCFDTSTDSNNSSAAATSHNRYRPHAASLYASRKPRSEALACDYPTSAVFFKPLGCAATSSDAETDLMPRVDNSADTPNSTARRKMLFNLWC
ncbi:hypothetical protein B0H13DRAFT_1900648 [Mycena leptocephala]|nr:hypothetical protein B0H13DRAFT_1900648 [Mycena leptocephala]